MAKKEAISRHISDKTKLQLWVKAGGRCQFKGCNENLLKDDLSYADINNAHIAHIIDVNEKTHRYSDDPKIKKNELPNLMLLCQKHHRLIDNEGEKEYTVDKLTEYKKEHEARILNLTSIKESVKTNVLFYVSRIGQFQPNIDFAEARKVLTNKNLFPNSEPIEIGVKNSVIQDNDPLFWIVEEKNLVESFEARILKVFENSQIKHFSCFAIATQPLLIKLGTLIPDLYTVDVYQKHREPDTWEWQKEIGDFTDFEVIEPNDISGYPVLNLSLSAHIENDRIKSVLDGNLSIWKFTIPNPNNNFLVHPEILVKFREKLRTLFNKIKKIHGHNNVLKVFPCMPNSASVEFGRVWMPKADLNLEIYDERNGFKKAITIKRD